MNHCVAINGIRQSTTSLCCSVMSRDKMAGLWKSLHRDDYGVLMETPQWQNPSRCKAKEKTTAKVISHHEEQTQQQHITTLLGQRGSLESQVAAVIPS